MCIVVFLFVVDFDKDMRFGILLIDDCIYFVVVFVGYYVFGLCVCWCDG